MDFSELQERYSPIFRKYLLPIILGLCGFVFLLYGLIASFGHKAQTQDILAEGVADSSVSADVAGAKSSSPGIILDIEGAVLKPGVYKLEKDARIQDALIVSGGMSERADRGKVAKGLNLASKVVDGGKIYIPFAGEQASPQGGSSGSQVSGIVSSTGDSASGQININSATSSQLDSLPGVGAVTAEKIINNRPYEKIEDLVSKKAVSQSVLEKIKDRISVY